MYNNCVKLPSTMIIPYIEKKKDLLNMLINSVFPNIPQYATNLDTMINQVILTPRNDYVDDRNNLLIHHYA